MSGLRFDPDAFVAECRAAADESDAPAAVREVVEAAVLDGSSIDAALGTSLGEPDNLFSSDSLTVQRIRWPRGIRTWPHDHRMWAVIGVYAGYEQNRFYERSPERLLERAARTVTERDVLVLDADAIHSVETPHLSVGLHVYGGDILNAERSAWGPDGREGSYREEAAALRAMFQTIREVAAERSKVLDGEARYRAMTALQDACDRKHRHQTGAEARQVVAEAWNLKLD
jgi:predicted metal-dependent enzyme (double-stranded beta helix superfamily)